MKKITLFFTFFLSFYLINAQLPQGSIAPDFTGTDLNGNQHNLYDILSSGKSVILDFSATWCPPCWSYKNSGVLEDVFQEKGPNGSNEVMIFFIESDASTGLNDLKGLTPNSMGNWIAGTNYPIIDDASIGNKYAIGSYPTVLLICKDGTISSNLIQLSSSNLKTAIGYCPDISEKPGITFGADSQAGCGQLTVQFFANFWPPADTYSWDFGDGTTSSEKNPSHTFNIEGTFDVKLTAINSIGNSVEIKENYIVVGKGGNLENKQIGPMDKSIGSGKYFEGGHQGLVFDVFKPMILSEVTVFSEKDAVREIVVSDENGNIVNRKILDIPAGKQRIKLDFFFEAGTNYRIGLGSNAYLFRNDSGVNYPYEVEGLMSIKSSTATQSGYYYYFYDWAVRPLGCDESLSLTEKSELNLAAYPNPVESLLTIEREDVDTFVELINVNGQVLWSCQNKKKVINIDVSNYKRGVYFLKQGSSYLKINVE